MINLSKFSRMSFTELVSLPNYYIHEIYKLFVEDAKARAKKEEEEARKRAAQQRQEARLANKRNPSNNVDVDNLRQSLAGATAGLNQADLEELLEDFG